MHAAKFWRGLDFALEGTGAEPLRALAREVRKRKNWEEPNILPVRASARHRSAPRCRVGQLHEVVLRSDEQRERSALASAGTPKIDIREGPEKKDFFVCCAHGVGRESAAVSDQN